MKHFMHLLALLPLGLLADPIANPDPSPTTTSDDGWHSSALNPDSPYCKVIFNSHSCFDRVTVPELTFSAGRGTTPMNVLKTAYGKIPISPCYDLRKLDEPLSEEGGDMTIVSLSFHVSMADALPGTTKRDVMWRWQQLEARHRPHQPPVHHY
jgi:hypothetical protein